MSRDQVSDFMMTGSAVTTGTATAFLRLRMNSDFPDQRLILCIRIIRFFWPGQTKN